MRADGEMKMYELLNKIVKESEKNGLTARTHNVSLSAREIFQEVSYELEISKSHKI